MKAMEVKKDIYWIGALDPNLRTFDIVMHTPYGTTYNSYIVKGSEKTAVVETVKEKFFDQYIDRLNSLNIDPSKIDYIIVDHTEPDHAGSIAKLLDIAKNAVVVGSAAAIKFSKAIANRDFKSLVVNNGDTLSLGNKTLKFISAPMLHWPDTIYTYAEEDKLLFTCDSFGAHYCNENVFNDLNPSQKDYNEALKHYFDCIISPFKPYVLKAIDKIKDLDIDMICTGHGPILRENPWKVVNLYKEWSLPKQKDNNDGNIVMCYVSAYGYTESIANKIEEGVKSAGNFNFKKYDVEHNEIPDIIEKINDADGLLFGSPTMLGDALKPIWEVLYSLNPIIHGGKIAAVFGSYGWSGEAVRNMEERLKQLRMNIIKPGLRINFKPTEDELKQAYNFGQSFAKKIQEKLSKGVKPSKPATLKKWKCLICGEIFEGAEPPKICPVCGATQDQFIEVQDSVKTFANDTDEKFVIIGNGAAGYYAAESIRSRNKKAGIQFISGESKPCYYRPVLSDYLNSEIEDKDFYVTNKDWYNDNNIKLTLNSFVNKIDTKNKKVFLNNGAEAEYDKLILANGSSNFIPPIPGNTKEGVFTLKYLSDADKIKAYFTKVKKAVVIGGGLLGLEAAWEMKKAGLDVTVVEFFDRLLPRQLDKEGAEIFKKIVDNSGVKIILGSSAVEILGDSNVTGIKLNNGETLDCEMVLFSVGIRPNKALAEAAGIKCDKGILVNDKMMTNIDSVYACGDVAQINGRVYGNWPAAVGMGKVAGANACGDESYFNDFVSSVVFSSMNADLFSCGSFDEGCEELAVKDASKGIYKKLFFKNDKLVGAMLIGDTKKSGKITLAIQSGKTFNDVLTENLL
ncbi:FAD-dependent oxidoreductase [Clostridium sp. JN-9]|uniref:FAD-dependent oxidoreductase n=1 Tax=Clostridium sp. JN-9 TaxID=2507159 RepID=UPI000FFE1960|nr:FAD-dependent oxidoreductase [Clostridium sp. JN-9]QAT41277.1 MBL fold metallo-hydrolase [Clostridium sp. JN-9]